MKCCPHCLSKAFIKSNFYFVKHSRTHIRRYKCLSCKRTFSKRTGSSIYRQKKPFLNSSIRHLLASGNTQRRTAKLLACSKHTVARKLIWLSQHLNEIVFAPQDFEHIQIDELETIEHTKLKPLTIAMCVSQNYKILGFGVGSLRAKGHLAKIAYKKYGLREDKKKKTFKELLAKLKVQIKTEPKTITTDANPMYPDLIRKYFPKSEHIQVTSRDQLKKKRELIYTAERKKVFDPLFALNQRIAMLRADIRRLTRRSWCTTKKVENLRHHLTVYQDYNNTELI